MSRLTEDMTLAGVAILPADGHATLPYEAGWRIIRSIRPEGPEPMLLWLQVRDGMPALGAAR